MARRVAADALRAVRQELASFLDAFDSSDAEDAQVRTDALISSMVKAGVLKDDGRLKGFRLHVALERVQLPVPNRETLVTRAEMFHDLISSYGGEPDETDMETAKTLLEEIANALNSAIDVKMKKRAE
jgi:hypothetical protein